MTKSVASLAASPKYDKMIQEHEKNRIGFDPSRPRIFYPRVDSAGSIYPDVGSTWVSKIWFWGIYGCMEYMWTMDLDCSEIYYCT